MKAERLILANPARRVHVAGRNPSVPVPVPVPLPAHQVTAIAEAATGSPALRDAVGLAGVYADATSRYAPEVLSCTKP